MGFNKRKPKNAHALSRSNLPVSGLIEKYEVTVFTLAMNLTGDECVSRDVVEEVFVRLANEINGADSETTELMLHRFTYDAALTRLLGSIPLNAAPFEQEFEPSEENDLAGEFTLEADTAEEEALDEF